MFDPTCHWVPSHQLAWKCRDPCRKTTFLLERGYVHFHVGWWKGTLGPADEREILGGSPRLGHHEASASRGAASPARRKPSNGGPDCDGGSNDGWSLEGSIPAVTRHEPFTSSCTGSQHPRMHFDQISPTADCCICLIQFAILRNSIGWIGRWNGACQHSRTCYKS